MVNEFDAIVIGTGQSGPSLAARLSQEGMKVAVIERDLFGGTCVNTGCIPTKTLVASARVAQMARRAAEYGVRIDAPIKVDMKAVKARKDALAGASNKGVEKWMKSLDNTVVYEGHGSFESPGTVSVDGDLLAADKIFINVGTRAFVPDIPGISEIGILTNSGMMEIDFLPAHLVIIGGGYVGLEFAQIYRRFGSEVTMVIRDAELLGLEDSDVREAIRGILEMEGVRLLFNTTVERFERHGEEVLVHTTDPAGEGVVSGSHVLVAAGRVPNTHDLGLDKAGVEVDGDGFIKVNDELKTNVNGIWAIGDSNGQGAFTHTSYNDYEIVAANLFDGEARRVSDRIPCYALYIDPPLGRVGMTEQQALATNRKVLIGKRMMTNVARAREFGETLGFMKVLVDANTEEILGAAILGLNGDEVVHSILDVMYAKAPYTTISRAVHIHPTVTELIPTMLGDLKPLG